MSRQRLARRITVLEARTWAGVDPGLVAQLAAEAGCTPDELIAEAEDLAHRFEQAGARTWDDRLALVATDLAMPVAELRAELAAMEAMP